MSIRCEVCNQGPQQGITVYRVNAKGQPGIWRCRPHMDSPPPKEVEEIVRIIEEPKPFKENREC